VPVSIRYTSKHPRLLLFFYLLLSLLHVLLYLLPRSLYLVFYLLLRFLCFVFYLLLRLLYLLFYLLLYLLFYSTSTRRCAERRDESGREEDNESRTYAEKASDTLKA